MSDATLEKRFSAFLSEAPDALHVMHSFDFGRFDAGKPFGSRVSRLRPTLYYVLSGLLHLQCTERRRPRPQADHGSSLWPSRNSQLRAGLPPLGVGPVFARVLDRFIAALNWDCTVKIVPTRFRWQGPVDLHCWTMSRLKAALRKPDSIEILPGGVLGVKVSAQLYTNYGHRGLFSAVEPGGHVLQRSVIERKRPTQTGTSRAA